MKSWALQSLGGTVEHVASHETRVLAGPPALWILEAGSIGVAWAPTRGRRVTGPRHFLFRGGAGQVAWSTREEGDDAPRLLLVPVERVRIRVVQPARLIEALGRAEPEILELVDGWTERLCEQLRDMEAPRDCVRAAAGSEATLAATEALRVAGDAPVWLRVREGRVRLCGQETWTQTAEDAPLPLAPGAWLAAEEGATVVLEPTRELADEATLLGGLGRLEAQVLEHVSRRALEEEAREEARLRGRGARDAAGTQAAAREVSAALHHRIEDPEAATPLLSAFSAIGRQIGVEIRAPRRAPGTGPREVAAIARASGVRVRAVLLEPHFQGHDCGPLLAFRREDQLPIALLRGRGQHYEAFDPVARTRRRLTDDLAAQLAPQAWTVYRPLPPRALGLGDLLRFSLHGRVRDLLWMLGTAVAATLLGMLMPVATALVMDVGIPDANRQLVLELGLALLAAACGQVLFSLSQGYVALRMSTRARASGQAAVWDRLLAMRPSFFRAYASGDLMHRATAVQRVGDALGGSTLSGLFSGIMALLNLGLLLYYSPQLALLALLVAGLTAAVTSLSAGLIRREAVRLQEVQGRNAGFEIQLVQGVTKLRVAGAEPRAYAQWLRRQAEQLHGLSRIGRVEDGTAVANTLIPALSTAALFWFAYALLAPEETGLSIGIFLAFYVAYGTFLAGATAVSNTLVGLLDAVAAARRIRPILEEAPETQPDRAEPARLTGRFALEHVSFRYRPDGPLVLEDVSLHAEPGEFVAVVGTSGSGKSTLLRLLLGFEAPESGVVLYDGQDLGGLDVRAVRRQLGIVLQGGRVSSGSVLDNIATGGAVSLDDAWDAARAAGLAEDLEQMPMGMHTVVSEGGTNLSGGQRQRLLIARALVYRPRILMFDEATSALDNRTQAIVSASLEQRKVTRLVIAHRLSTIRKADRIYVIDAGRVAEVGTFEELQRGRGLFARMMVRQLA